MDNSGDDVEKRDRPTGYAAVGAGIVLIIIGLMATAMWAILDPLNYMPAKA